MPGRHLLGRFAQRRRPHAERVSSAQEDGLVLRDEDARELTDGRRLAGTVHTNHEDDSWLRCSVRLRAGQIKRAVHVGADEGQEFLAQDLADARLVSRGLDGDAALECLHEGVGRLQAEVRDEQGLLDFFPVCGTELASAENSEDRAAKCAGGSETFTQALHAPAHGFGPFDGRLGGDLRFSRGGGLFRRLGAGARPLWAFLIGLRRRWALAGGGHLGLGRDRNIVGRALTRADDQADDQADQHGEHQADDDCPRRLKE